MKSYEIGWKSQWALNRVRLNTALFHIDYTDLQFLAAVEGPGGAPIVLITNAVSSSTDGLEIEIVARPLLGLEIQLGYSYLDAVFDEYVDGAGIDQSGNRILRTPEHMGNFAVQYFLPIGSWGAFSLRGEWSAQSRMFFDSANVVSQPAFDLYNARIGVEHGPWSFGVWGKNLGDEHHCKNTISVVYGSVGLCTSDAPRTWGMSFGRRF